MENIDFKLMTFSEFLDLFFECEDNTPEDSELLTKTICDLLGTTPENILAFDEGIDERLNDVSDYTKNNMDILCRHWIEDKSKPCHYLELSSESGYFYMGEVFNKPATIYTVMGYSTIFIAK